jgi:hypothetical protein
LSASDDQESKGNAPLTLIVTVKKASETREASDAKDFGILDQGSWPGSALESLTTLQSDLVELR